MDSTTLKIKSNRDASGKAKRILYRKRQKLRERYNRALNDELKNKIAKDIKHVEKLLTELREECKMPEKQELKAISKTLQGYMHPPKYSAKNKLSSQSTRKGKVPTYIDNEPLNAREKEQFCKGFQRGFEAGLKALVHGRVENRPLELTPDLMEILKEFTCRISEEKRDRQNNQNNDPQSGSSSGREVQSLMNMEINNGNINSGQPGSYQIGQPLIPYCPRNNFQQGPSGYSSGPRMTNIRQSLLGRLGPAVFDSGWNGYHQFSG